MMLCQRGRLEDVLEGDEYGFDLKVDGIRCTASIEQQVVRLRSRGGEDITTKFPEVVAALLETFGQASTSGAYVLDGELAVLDARGLPDWPSTHKRQAAGSKVAGRLPAVYFAFDVLEAEEDLRSRPFWYRRQLLESYLGTEGVARAVLHTRDGAAMWQLVQEHHLEGMVAKKLISRYRSGRARDWLKIKDTSTVTCAVGGFDPGIGSRKSTFGALWLFLLDDSNALVRVGTVGSGFSDRELRSIRQQLDAGLPFVVEVQYLDVTPDGQLRQPVFLRVRTDVGLADCTHSQLTYMEVAR